MLYLCPLYALTMPLSLVVDKMQMGLELLVPLAAGTSVLYGLGAAALICRAKRRRAEREH